MSLLSFYKNPKIIKLDEIKNKRNKKYMSKGGKIIIYNNQDQKFRSILKKKYCMKMRI